MYSYLLKAAVLPEESYDFYTFNGDKPVTVEFRGKPIIIHKGTRFGVRPSTSGKHIRMVFPSDPTRVITIDPETAKKLAQHVSKPRPEPAKKTVSASNSSSAMDRLESTEAKGAKVPLRMWLAAAGVDKGSAK